MDAKTTDDLKRIIAHDVATSRVRRSRMARQDLVMTILPGAIILLTVLGGLLFQWWQS